MIESWWVIESLVGGDRSRLSWLRGFKGCRSTRPLIPWKWIVTSYVDQKQSLPSVPLSSNLLSLCRRSNSPHLCLCLLLLFLLLFREWVHVRTPTSIFLCFYWSLRKEDDRKKEEGNVFKFQRYPRRLNLTVRESNLIDSSSFCFSTFDRLALDLEGKRLLLVVFTGSSEWETRLSETRRATFLPFQKAKHEDDKTIPQQTPMQKTVCIACFAVSNTDLKLDHEVGLRSKRPF